MSVILTRGDSGQLEMHMHEAEIARVHKAHSRDDGLTKVPKLPRVKSLVCVRYDDWLDKYHDYLAGYVDDLYDMMVAEGLAIHYHGFKADLLRYIYGTSVSRYRGFTFLGN